MIEIVCERRKKKYIYIEEIYINSFMQNQILEKVELKQKDSILFLDYYNAYHYFEQFLIFKF